MDEAHPAGSGEHGAGPQASLRYGQALQGVSAIIAPATLLTGIAFYFGWQRVRSFDEYFGLNPGAVGYSTRDYVLNSLDALFLPVVVVLIALIAFALGHAYVTDAQRTGRRSPATLHRLSEAALVLGALLLFVGGLAAFSVVPFHTPYLIATLFPAVGVLLIAHAVDQRERLRGDPPLSTAARVFVVLFVAVCLFWAAGLYAQTVGRNQAVALARNLDVLPAVTLSSSSDLGLNRFGNNAVIESVGAKTHTYSGLRLLAVDNGTMWLLPERWKPAAGRLFAVPEADATGLAFTPAPVQLTGNASANNFSNSSVPGATASATGNPPRRPAESRGRHRREGDRRLPRERREEDGLRRHARRNACEARAGDGDEQECFLPGRGRSLPVQGGSDPAGTSCRRPRLVPVPFGSEGAGDAEGRIRPRRLPALLQLRASSSARPRGVPWPVHASQAF